MIARCTRPPAAPGPCCKAVWRAMRTDAAPALRVQRLQLMTPRAA